MFKLYSDFYAKLLKEVCEEVSRTRGGPATQLGPRPQVSSWASAQTVLQCLSGEL